MHLDYKGAIALSTGLAEALSRARPGPSADSCWIALPACHSRPADAPVENLGESRRLVRVSDAAALR